MNFAVYTGFGILLVLAIIGLVILLRRSSLKSENNKRICTAIGVLQVVHIGLYLTGILDKLAQTNVSAAFGICAALSLVCLVMAVWILLPSSRLKYGIKYLIMFVAVLQVVGTIVIFFMPD